MRLLEFVFQDGWHFLGTLVLLSTLAGLFSPKITIYRKSKDDNG
jgi:hypothetical protein